MGRRVGWNGERIAEGHWTLRDLFPIIEGYLLRLRDQRTTAVVPTDSKPKQPATTDAAGDSATNSQTGFLGGAALAKALGVHATRREAFFRQLERQRMSLGDDCWHEVRDPRPNCPRFLYRVDSTKLRDLAAAYKNPKPA